MSEHEFCFFDPTYLCLGNVFMDYLKKKKGCYLQASSVCFMLPLPEGVTLAWSLQETVGSFVLYEISLGALHIASLV